MRVILKKTIQIQIPGLSLFLMRRRRFEIERLLDGIRARGRPRTKYLDSGPTCSRVEESASSSELRAVSRYMVVDVTGDVTLPDDDDDDDDDE